MFYIYRITNLVNSKTYIGQHKHKKLNDSYLGSGGFHHTEESKRKISEANRWKKLSEKAKKCKRRVIINGKVFYR